jgi:hypothetical protein
MLHNNSALVGMNLYKLQGFVGGELACNGTEHYECPELGFLYVCIIFFN